MNLDPDEHAVRAEGLADAIDERLDVDPAAAVELARSADPQLASHPAVRLATALAVGAASGPRASLPLLLTLVRDHPDSSDARHALGRAYDSLGDVRAAAEHYLRVLELDEADDTRNGFDAGSAAGEIYATTQRVFEQLPEPFRSRLRHVPIVIEPRPSRDLVAEGFDPRSLGMFEGSDQRGDPWAAYSPPPRILLYSANLTVGAHACTREGLAREVEITILHEIGHYFGLDEEQLDALGLG